VDRLATTLSAKPKVHSKAEEQGVSQMQQQAAFQYRSLRFVPCQCRAQQPEPSELSVSSDARVQTPIRLREAANDFVCQA